MNKLAKKIYKKQIKIIENYLRKDYPDFRKMPKNMKERFNIVKENYKSIAIISANTHLMPVRENEYDK